MRARAARRATATTAPVVLVTVALATARATTARATTAAEEASFYLTKYSPNDAATCEVGPYGWFCAPSNIEYSTQVWDPNTAYEADDVTASTSECAYCGICATCETGNLTCVRNAAAVCYESCTDDEVRARLATCDVEMETCMSLYHDVVRYDLRQSVGYAYEFYVNEFNGSDAWLGTRSEPWKTLARAERRVRFMRAVTEASGLGKELAAPIQVWIRDLKADGGLDAKNNTHNGRYSGKTYLK